MSVIKTIRFRLDPGADVEAFLASNKKVQSGFTYRQPGILRRTVARSHDGAWVALELWDSHDAADAAWEQWLTSPLAAEYMGFIDRDSVEVDLYDSLD